MVKKFVKSMLTLGLLLSIPQFSLRAEGPLVQTFDFESYLKPQDLLFLEQDEAMVYMSPDFIEIAKRFSYEVQELKDLATHVQLGYCVAPQREVVAAVEYALKAFEMKSEDYAILKGYQQAILNGDALIKTDETRRSRQKCARFCTLFARTASIGCLQVNSNASICGNLNVGGTLNVANLSFTGATCATVVALPTIAACGNISFNNGGPNALNAQGAVEASLRAMRGTMTFAASTITLTPVGAPGTAVTVANTLPTASIPTTPSTGIVATGVVTATAFSSGIVVPIAVAPAPVLNEYYFVINIQAPVTFAPGYSTVPSMLVSLQNALPVVTTGTALVDANTATVIDAVVSNVATTGATINMVFQVTAQGLDYTTAAANAATAVNNIISSPTLSNPLSVNILVDGPVV